MKKGKIAGLLTAVSIICIFSILMAAMPAFAVENEYNELDKNYTATFGVDSAAFNALSDEEKWELTVGMDSNGSEKTPFYTKIEMSIIKNIAVIVDTFPLNLSFVKKSITKRVTDILDKYSSPNSVKPDGEASTVYFTTDISPEGLMKVYEALGWTPTGNVAVKLSTGEGENSNNLDPQLISKLVNSVNGTIVECNTAYPGSRSSTALHKKVAEQRGYTAIANVDIMDAEGSIKLPVTGGKHLKYDLVGSHFKNYDSFIVLSHFKGHTMGGFGGAIKNISIGIGSSSGKCLIHTAGKSTVIMVSPDQDSFLESMAEAGKSVSDSLGNGERIIYINVMNNISVDCDCVANPSEPTMADVGILASTDPVALDQACVDIVYQHADTDGADVIERIESRNGIHTLDYAEQIGLGNRKYTLVNIDE